VKDSDQCCFGGEPKLVDMLGVYMKGPHLTDYYSGRVSVAGTFRLNREYKGGKLEALFQLEGVEVKPSASDFDPVKPLDLSVERARLEAAAKEELAKRQQEQAVSAAKEQAAPAAVPSPEQPVADSKTPAAPQP
jgi:hypothetical protein